LGLLREAKLGKQTSYEKLKTFTSKEMMIEEDKSDKEWEEESDNNLAK